MRQEDHKFEASQGCNNGLLRASGTQASRKPLCFMLETCLLQGLQWARKPPSLHRLLWKDSGVLRPGMLPTYLPSPSSQLEESQDGEGVPCPIPHTPCVCSVPESETPVDTNLIELDTK